MFFRGRGWTKKYWEKVQVKLEFFLVKFGRGKWLKFGPKICCTKSLQNESDIQQSHIKQCTHTHIFKAHEILASYYCLLQKKSWLYWLLHDHILVDDLVEEFEAVEVEDVDVSYLCTYQQLFTVVRQTAHRDPLHTTGNTNSQITNKVIQATL